MKKIVAELMALTTTLLTATVFGQAYPAKPIRLVVPFPPGAATDVLARTIGQKLGESFGQAVVSDNRPGAGGGIGMELVAKAVPDGYTVLMGNVASNAINVNVFAKLPIDPIADFAPVSLVVSTPNILVVHPSLPVKSVKELIELAKSRPGQLNFSSPGTYSLSHLAGELFKAQTGVKLLHVPYKSGGLALANVLAGNDQFGFVNMPVTLPSVRAGKLRGIAVTSLKRSLTAPELPTMAEAGVPGYEAIVWYGLFAPARTPKPIVEKLHAAIVKILAQPDVRESFKDQGNEPVGNTPEEFAAYIKSEIAKWNKVIKLAGTGGGGDPCPLNQCRCPNRTCSTECCIR